MAKTKAVAAPAARVRGKTKPEPVQKGILKKKPEKEPKKDKGKDPKSSKAPKSKDKKEKEERKKDTTASKRKVKFAEETEKQPKRSEKDKTRKTEKPKEKKQKCEDKVVAKSTKPDTGKAEASQKAKVEKRQPEHDGEGKKDKAKDKKDKKGKKEKKDKKDKKDTPPSDCTTLVLSTPLNKNRGLESQSSDLFSPSGGTPVLLQQDDLSDIETAAKEAKAKGISLADHMKEVSEARVEKHMLEIVAAAAAKSDKKEDKEDQEDKQDREDKEETPTEAEEEEDDDEEEEDEGSDGGGSSAGEDTGEGDGDRDSEKEDSSTDTSSEESSSEEVEAETNTEEGSVAANLANISEAIQESTTQIQKANSKTHHKEWCKFSRQCMDKAKFPASLATYYLQSKTDLFQEWINCAEDWSKVELNYERRVTDKRQFKKSRKGMKPRDIIKQYGQEKGEALMSKLKERSMYEEDEDFPSDPDEYWYYVGQGGEVSRKTGVDEATSVRINDREPNKEMVLALTSEGAPLGPGAMPRIGRTNEAGEKAVMEALTNEGTTKAKKAKAKKEEKGNKETEEMLPQTPKEEALALSADVLKSATEARKYALALKHLNYSGELVRSLMDFSSKMENAYDKITKYSRSNNVNDKDWTDIIKFIQAQQKWYEQAEAAAKGLQNGMGPKRKAKKGKGKEASPEVAAS